MHHQSRSYDIDISILSQAQLTSLDAQPDIHMYGVKSHSALAQGGAGDHLVQYAGDLEAATHVRDQHTINIDNKRQSTAWCCHSEDA